jgi:leucyl-tRNA synthetase
MSSTRRQYPFHLIEPKWQKIWDEQQAFRAFNPGEEIPANHPFAIRHKISGKVSAPQLPPKFYILDMFPYPSGAGLHVGHPEGYTATDILARYKRAQGFNVLHPMGWDAFGLPAEQYAVKTGQHPRKTTEENIATFKRQIKSLGFSYDWSRELATTDPDYFKWTQWIFLKLYNSYFDWHLKKAMPIELIEDALSENPKFKDRWNKNLFLLAVHKQWLGFSVKERNAIRNTRIDSLRLAYVTEAPVWWCEELGTVLANEEVIDGKSEVGGFSVVRKPMRQWMLRITEYAERLLADLNTIDWSDSLKEMQRNWIGRSEGAEIRFEIEDFKGANLPKLPFGLEAAMREIFVFTTRPDTLFGATYIVVSPEHMLFKTNFGPVNWPENTPDVWKHGFALKETPDAPRKAIDGYYKFASAKSDLERTALAKDKTGVFSGLFAINPVNQQRIPIFIADYVLASYGTGAIMAVPAHDVRDFEFANKLNLPIVQVVEPPAGKDWKGFTDEGIAVNSANSEISLNGLPTVEAKEKIIKWLESKKFGKRTINYKLRDWLFSRQRYWGEPFPIVWKRDASGNLFHEALPEKDLPVLPPELKDYKPTATGEPPLARAKDWVNLPDGSVRETNTMPQWAGSCWYYLRYLDAKNNSAFVGKDAENYWMGADSPKPKAQSPKPDVGLETLDIGLKSTTPGVDLYVGGTEHAVLHLLYARFWHKVLFDLGYVSTPEPFFKLVNQGMVLGEDNQKMSKSRGNVIPVDVPVAEVGTDAMRLYEMFMGPLEMVKPWSTKGVEGVYRFLGRVWRLFVDEKSETAFEQAETVTAETQRSEELLDLILLDGAISDVAATPAQLKTLHACIKKVTEDLDGLRFNTAISAMMVFVNDAITWETKPLSVMKTFLQLLAPFAPHLAEELWARLHATFGQTAPSLAYAPWPKFDAALLVESEIEIPVQVNGKLRDVIKISATTPQADLEAAAKNSEKVKLFIEGKTIKKIIVVPKKMVNLIVG